MNVPKVSIMIPTYNQQQHIIRAIESALEQDYPNIDVVVSDDSSTDQTCSVVESFLRTLGDTRVKYFRNEDNLGILRNYQKALYEHANGDWVINLDGDDFFVDSRFISRCMNVAASDTSIVLIFGNYCEYNQDSGDRIDVVNANMPPVMDGDDFVSRYSEDKVTWNHNSILYRRDDAVRVGFYWDDHAPRNDWESFLRLVINGRVGYVDSVSAAWVQHGSNETRRLDLAKYLNNYALIKGLGEFAAAQGVKPGLAETWVDNLMQKVTRESCVGYFRNRDYSGAREFLRHAHREKRMLVLKMALDPGLWIRGFLAPHPQLYARAKLFARKFVLH